MGLTRQFIEEGGGGVYPGTGFPPGETSGRDFYQIRIGNGVDTDA